MSSVREAMWRAAQGRSISAGEMPALDVDEGQALQLQILSHWLGSGEALAGYKVGLTSGAGRDAFGKGVRPFGYILKSRIFGSDDAAVRLTDIGRMGLENELVFRMGESLQGGDVSAADARHAVESVAPAFEINQTRIEGSVSSGIRVADNLSQWGIVTGEFIAPAQDYERLVVTLSRDGETLQTVSAEGHIDDHFQSIAALANRLHCYKRQLRAGMLVITGSFTRIPVKQGGTYVGDFGDVGRVTLHVH